MLLKIGIGLAIVIALFLGYVALQPADYAVSREIAIQASADKIFPYLNNQKLGEKWGPWKDVDPDVVLLYSGPDEGVGAKASWDTKGQLGTGSATISESIPNEKVGIELEYSEPVVMHQHSDYLIRADGSGSIVTWRVTGKNNFIGRLMCVFMDMDKVVGSMFEKGLANLKRIVETGN